MFSNLSASSISFATVTPSLVMVGAPNDLARTTLRPLGPSVTLTALASLSTPRSSARRASSSKLRIFAMDVLSDFPPRQDRPGQGREWERADRKRPGRAKATGAL